MKPLIVVFLLLNLNVYSQENLVPNPSFEEHTGCPQGYPDLDGKLNDWQSLKGTPDYFNICSDICGSNNGYGYQEPNTGEAYTGIVTYGITIPNVREHLSVALTSPLIIGGKYYVSLYVSTAWNYTGMNIATNKIGALFTTYQNFELTNDDPLPNFSHIKTDVVINDTINWIKISESFIADSSYTYINLGNFYDDQHTDTINLPFEQVNQRSFYYIDDICVSTDSIYANSWVSVNELQTSKNNLSIYPNPGTDFINILSINPINTIEMFNIEGKLLLKTLVNNINQPVIDIQNLENGIYNLKIHTSTFVVDKPLTINH